MDSQKARVRWLREEDQNSRFFHALLNHRKSRSLMVKLELEDGSVVSGEGQIEDAVVEYFAQLYKKSEHVGGTIDGVDWGPIGINEANGLEKLFSEEEIRKAVFDGDGANAWP